MTHLARRAVASLVALLCLLGTAAAQADGRPTNPIPDYRTALPLVWGKLYPEGGETLYCGRQFGKRKGRRINVEHVFPMSWVAWHLSCGRRNECRDASPEFNRIEADLHNLWPARIDVNEARASHPFGIIPGEARPFGDCDFEVDEARRLVEPRPAVRGEIARTMFYMAETYGLEIRSRLGRTLQDWHRADPPSAEERRRNDLIETIQGNRNPFVDDPRRATRLRF